MEVNYRKKENLILIHNTAGITLQQAVKAVNESLKYSTENNYPEMVFRDGIKVSYRNGYFRVERETPL